MGSVRVKNNVGWLTENMEGLSERRWPEETVDVYIQVDDVLYPVHKLALVTKSTILKKILLDHGQFEKRPIILRIQNFSMESVEALIMWMYFPEQTQITGKSHIGLIQ